jgi:probable rRNA maturation factor
VALLFALSTRGNEKCNLGAAAMGTIEQPRFGDSCPRRILRRARRALNCVVILKKSVPGLAEAALARFLARARRAVRLRGSIDVVVTGAQDLRRLNRRFRGKNQPTDVLSFPAGPGTQNGFAGDVAICAEIAARNARHFGHSPAQEIKILALHGVLHLAGYDHARDHGEMERQEASLRRLLGLPAGLIERSVRRETKAAPPTR